MKVTCASHNFRAYAEELQEKYIPEGKTRSTWHRLVREQRIWEELAKKYTLPLKYPDISIAILSRYYHSPLMGLISEGTEIIETREALL
jgi:hypothetical protein